MNFWDMSSPGIGLVVSIPNIVLSTRFMMILWPFLSPWGTIMQSKFIEILFCFYIGKINDLTISSVYFFRNQNLYECLLMRLPAYHLPIRPIFLRLDIKRKTLIINYQCFYKSVGVTRFELATTRPPDAYSKPGWATPRTIPKPLTVSECKYRNIFVNIHRIRLFFFDFLHKTNLPYFRATSHSGQTGSPSGSGMEPDKRPDGLSVRRFASIPYI